MNIGLQNPFYGNIALRTAIGTAGVAFLVSANPEDVYKDPLSSQLSIKTVLVYCPFDVLSERVAERNRQAIGSQLLKEES